MLLRRRSAQFWLILLLLAGVAAPSPRMAGHLLGGRHQSGPPLARKLPALRGLNRLGAPAPTSSLPAAACRVGAPEPPRPAPVVTVACPLPPRSPAAPPAAPAPIAPRLRC